MNNDDFRTLLGEPSAIERSNSKAASSTRVPGFLGARGRQSVPLTPRNLKGSASSEFHRQTSERKAAGQPSKKFKSSAAPRGSKFGSAYTDRALERQSGDIDVVQDNRETRLKALEEQLKLGQIKAADFEVQRDIITGGDITATHLVKGLDRKLLERIRRGEDVLATPPARASLEIGDAIYKKTEEECDEEFDILEQREVAPLQHDEVRKKGEIAPPGVKSGAKRSRADILAELKASRQTAPLSSPQPQLGSRFSKIGAQKSSTPLQKDDSGREVLITVDAEGRVKRKIKKPAVPALGRRDRILSRVPPPSANAQPLGMVIPTTRCPPEAADQEMDIFDNVGSAYNPLGDEEEEESRISSDEEQVVSETRKNPILANARIEATGLENSFTNPPEIAENLSPFPDPDSMAGKKNYFGQSEVITRPVQSPIKPLHDPIVLAALQRATALESKRAETLSTAVETEQLTDRQRKLLASGRDRDLDDMDLGFGSSRFEDDEEEGDSRKKLSEWRGGLEDKIGEGHAKGGGSSQRKRGKKKRQGDKNSAADIFRIIEGRKTQPTS